jgi:anti-sigma factor RsiW
MSRTTHLAHDEIVALTYADGAATDGADAEALVHATECDVCAGRLAEIAAAQEDLRLAAAADADVRFPEAVLERQRRQILARLEGLRHTARVLRFPAAAAPARPPVTDRPARRWVVGAAAAGILVGAFLVESLHLLPGGFGWTEDRAAGVEAAAATPLDDDDAFLTEIDAALQFSRSSELRALDALTPVLYEIR